MKVIYIYDTIYPYTFGGVEKRIWELAKRLAQRGHEVHIFGPKYWEGKSIFKKGGVYLHGVCNAPGRRFVEGRRSIGWPIYFAVRVLPGLLKERFDIIDCQNFPYFPCFSAKLASIMSRTPLVISWYEIWGDYWYNYLGLKGAFGKIIEKMTTKLPHRIIVETKTNKNSLASWGFNKDNIAVIPSGVSFDQIQKEQLSTHKHDVIFVGRLVKDKGTHTLIESISYLEARKIKVSVAIIGDGPERKSLEILAQQLGMKDRIKFYGEVAQDREVISIMKSAKVFVYPAVPAGGWALTLVEANACGLPIISVKSGALGTNEAVIDNYNGFLVEEQSPILIADKIALIIENHQLRKELRRNSLSFSRSLDWENQAEAVEKVYQGLLKGQR